MRNQKMYEADDKMITLIADNYNILESLGRFGINLGFGDKTVKEVCEDQNVDTYTFLAIVNFSINGYRQESDENGRISVPTMLHYLKASHEYFLDFQLPSIRKGTLRGSRRERQSRPTYNETLRLLFARDKDAHEV